MAGCGVRLQAIHVGPVGSGQPGVDGGGERGGRGVQGGHLGGWAIQRRAQLSGPGQRVHGHHVDRGAGRGGHVVAVAHGGRPVHDAVLVVTVAARQVGDQTGGRVDGGPQVGGDPGQHRVHVGQQLAVSGGQPVAPDPLRVDLGEVGDVAGPLAARVDGVESAVGPVAGLGLGELQQGPAGQVLLTEGGHVRLGFVEAVAQEGSLLAGGRVDELLLGGELAGVGGQGPDGVQRRVRRGEGGGRTGRQLDVADLGHDIGGVEHLARIVDLEVAEAQVVEGLEGLGARTFEVRVAQVGGLGAPGGGHGAVGVEQVAGVHGDQPAGLALVEGHGRGGRHHRPEVGHVGPVGQAGQGPGHLGLGHDPRAAVHQVGPRGDRRPADHLRGGPGGGVEARLVPAQGGVQAVEVLGLVDRVALEVAWRAGQPRRPGHPPAAIGAQHLVAAVRMPYRDLRQHAGLSGRSALARARPVGEQAHGQGRAGSHPGGDVGALVVLRVGVAVGLARIDRVAVEVELVLLVGRDVGGGPDHRRRAHPEVVAGVGVGIGGVERIARGTGDPVRLPVVVAQSGDERGRRRCGAATARPVPGLDRPAELLVGGQGRAAVGDLALGAGADLTAVPHRPPRPGDHDPVAALGRPRSRVVHQPGEAGAAVVDAHGMNARRPP